MTGNYDKQQKRCRKLLTLALPLPSRWCIVSPAGKTEAVFQGNDPAIEVDISWIMSNFSYVYAGIERCWPWMNTWEGSRLQSNETAITSASSWRVMTSIHSISECHSWDVPNYDRVSCKYLRMFWAPVELDTFLSSMYVLTVEHWRVVCLCLSFQASQPPVDRDNLKKYQEENIIKSQNFRAQTRTLIS